MILSTLLLLIIGYLFAISEYSWKGGLLYTILVGFIQDPLRKISPIDSSYFNALALAFFLLTFVVLKNQHKSWYLKYVCWSNKRLLALIPVFLYLLGFQALNSFARSGDVRLPIVGLLFYLMPLLAIWIGFHIGSNTKILRNYMIFYLVGCSLTAISVLLSAQGVENDLFREVGMGFDITGFGKGNSGFWRTTEIAGWHLAAGACFAFILGMSESKGFQQSIFFFLSIGLTFLTTTTGRRKAFAMVIVFISMYLLYYSLTAKGNKIIRALTAFGMIALLSFSSFGLFFGKENEADLERFEERTSTLTLEETQGRFTFQGVGALIRGFEIAGPIGLGVGAGSNTGTTGINRGQLASQDFVSEGGGGRIIAELGTIGGIFFLYLLFQAAVMYIRNFKMGAMFLPTEVFSELVGLAMFVFTNLITFFTAGQLYSDPFVLIIIGLSAGTFLAIPLLASKQATTSQQR